MSIPLYLFIALSCMISDAIGCVIAEVKYKPLPSLVMSLAWPITMHVVLLGAAVMMRRYKRGEPILGDQRDPPT